MSIIGEAATVKLPSPYSSLTEPYVEYYTDSNGIDVRVVIHNMKYVQNQMFKNHTSLKSVTILSGTIKLGQYTFQYCTNLETVILPQTLTTIDNAVFQHCNSLKEIRFPSSLTSLSYGNFGSWPVYFYATTPMTLSANVLSSFTGPAIYVPSGSVNAYKTAQNWSAYADKIFAMEE